MGVEGDLMDQERHDSADEKFEWTYTSPEFSMMQVTNLLAELSGSEQFAN